MMYNKISSDTCAEIVSIFDAIKQDINNSDADIKYILYNYGRVLGGIVSKAVDESIDVCLDTDITFTAITAVYPNMIHIDVVNHVKISEATSQELTGMFLHELAHIILDKQISIRYDYLQSTIQMYIADAKIKGHSVHQLGITIYNSLFNTSETTSSEYDAVEILYLIRNNLYKTPFTQLPTNHTVESYCYRLVDTMYPGLSAVAKELHDRTTLTKGRFLIYNNIASYLSRVNTILSLIDDYNGLDSLAPVNEMVNSIIKATFIVKYALSYDDNVLEANTPLAKAVESTQQTIYNNLLDIRDSRLPLVVTKELLTANKLLDSMLPKGELAGINAYETYNMFTSVMSLEDDQVIVNAISKYTQLITKG